MANLIDIVQKNLQYSPLQTIDPNTQDIAHQPGESEIDRIGQAAIPAVLAGLYLLSANDDGCLKIMNMEETATSLSVLFHERETEVIQKVANYTGLSINQAKSHLENIADESTHLVN